jgi:transposase-like protein
MSGPLEDGIKRWTAKRKSALVIEIIQGKTTVAEASRSYDLAPSEIENWVDDARKGMENALKANPLDVRQPLSMRSRRTPPIAHSGASGRSFRRHPATCGVSS